MIIRILVTYYGVKLTGWENIDIAVDRHVARVFLRTGLVKIKSHNKLVKLSETKADIINKARQLSPKTSRCSRRTSISYWKEVVYQGSSVL